MKNMMSFFLWISLFAILTQCGRSKEDDGGSSSDARVPAGWDGKSDYSGSAFTISTAK